MTLAQGGARHPAGDLFLGEFKDVEADGQPDDRAGADESGGDDNADEADEDGVAVMASIVATADSATVASFVVLVSDAAVKGGVGKLDAWIDFNRDGDWGADGEQIFISEDVAAGVNLLSFDVPAGAQPGETFARFRLSSAGGLSPKGPAPDGEVEDYLVMVWDGDATSGVNVEIHPPLAGALSVVVDGDDVVAHFGAIELFRAPGSSLSRLSIDGTDGDDTVVVDFSGGSHPVAIDFRGGLQNTAANGDALVLMGGGTFARAVFTFDNSSDGSIDIAGNATITYAELERITSTIATTEVALNYSTASETISINHDDGTLDRSFNAIGNMPGTLMLDFGNSLLMQSDGKIIVAGRTDTDFAMARYNANFTLDEAFNASGGTPGTLTHDFGFSPDLFTEHFRPHLALQNDGKIIVAGTGKQARRDFVLARFNEDGSLDTTFNADGSRPGTQSLDLGGIEFLERLAIQDDGKIVLAGWSSTGSQFGLHQNLSIARFNSDGTLDTTFNASGNRPGTQTLDLSNNDRLHELSLQDDGKILVAGQTGTTDFIVARYNRDGTLDNSFNSSGSFPGTRTLDFGGHDFLSKLVIGPDGRILMAGSGGGDFAVARLKSNGTLDETFNAGGSTPGTHTLDIGELSDTLTQLAIQNDGKIVVAGYVSGGDSDFVVARFNSDGSLDTSFNSSGTTPGLRIDDLGGIDEPAELAIQNDGKIVVAGIGSSHNFAVVRYTADGSLDTTFNATGNTPGTNVQDFGGYDYISSLAIGQDGKLLVTGSAGRDKKFTLVRYGGTTVSSTAGAILALTDPTGSLVINAGDIGDDTININGLPANYAASILIDGQGGDDEINLNGSVSTDGKNVTLRSETLRATGPLAVGTGSVAITTDTISLGAAIAGTGSLMIKPQTPLTTIGIGGGVGTLNLDDAEIAMLIDGFSLITIGDATAGTVHVKTATFTDPIWIAGSTIHDATGTDLDVGSNVVTMEGKISPGQSPGILTIDGDFSFGPASSFEAEILGDTPGTEYDQMAVTGTVDLNNATLNINDAGFSGAGGGLLVLLENDGSDPIVGTFAGLPESSPVTIGGRLFRISYTGGDGGNDVVLALLPPTLSLSIDVDSISEDGGTATATVTRINADDLSQALTVNVSSDDTTEATAPTTVTISANETTSAPFTITAVNDRLVDGTQTITITASATGYVDATDTIGVTDGVGDSTIQLPMGETTVTNEDGTVFVRNEGNVLFQAPRGDVSELHFLGGSEPTSLAVGDLKFLDGNAVDLSFDGTGGADRFRLLEQAQTLDLTTLADANLQGMEIVDIEGTGPNVLILNVSEVVNIASAQNTLRVVHDEDDTVTYGGGWRVESPQIVVGQYVHVLTQDNVIVEIANTRPFQNPFISLDVNRDGVVSPVDALVVINRLNTSGSSELTTPVSDAELSNFFYLDTNGDSFVAPVDALVVVNFLNNVAGLANSEFTPRFATPGVVDYARSPPVITDANQKRSDRALVSLLRLPILLHSPASGTGDADTREPISESSNANNTELASAIDAFFADFDIDL